MIRAYIIGAAMLIALGALTASAWLGYRAGTASGETTQRIAADTLAADNASVLASVRQQAQQANAVAQRTLSAEQARTAALLAARDRITRTADQLREDLRNVKFHPPSTQPVAGLCPGNPIASPEFMRLYNAAAADTGQSGAPGNDRSARRVPAQRHRP